MVTGNGMDPVVTFFERNIAAFRKSSLEIFRIKIFGKDIKKEIREVRAKILEEVFGIFQSTITFFF